MTDRARPLLALLLVLGACSSAADEDANLDSLDAELTNSTATNAPGRDPALMSALQSQIMVDPSLAQQANADALRPADQPYAAPIPSEAIAQADAAPDAAAPGPQTGPLMKVPTARADCPQCETAKQAVTLGGLAARQKGAGIGPCVGGMRYSAQWAARMGEVPLYPQARLIEAAGNAGNGCALRVASFTTPADVQNVLDWYYTRTTSVGYESEHQAADGAHVLGGNRERDQAAFILFASPRNGGGTQIDLIVNNGN